VLFFVAGMICAACAGAASEREEFLERAAREDLTAFRALDLDRDGLLTHEEVRPDLSFGPRFDDADINRDGYIDSSEMQRYLEQTYGVKTDLRGEGPR
jgi:Ca2+-binding EF-hand superfamily protein